MIILSLYRRGQAREGRWRYMLKGVFPPASTLRRTLVPTLLLLTLGGCKSTPEAAAGPDANPSQRQRMEEIRMELDHIPPPSKSRYMAIHSLSSWENPYLTVQDNMLTLHVTLADANPSPMGQGGLLRPVGARRQDLSIRTGDLPVALNAVPASAWPYGRVIALEEAHNTPASVEPSVRRNMETAMKSLNDLGVVIYEWQEGGAGLR